MSDITKTSPFKLGVLGLFFLFATVGVIMFAMYQATGTSSNLGKVIIWGTIPKNKMDYFLTQYADIDSRILNSEYEYKDPLTFDQELTEALASGYSPDLVLLTNEQIMRNRNRIFPTPYENYDIRTFKNTFAQAAESLLLPEGVMGIPIAIDPMVLYWNRTLLSANQYPIPPKQWGELFKMSQKITRKDEAGTIEIATIALGETSNILHAKDIFISMLMQAGGALVKTDNNGRQISALTERNINGTSPAQDALRFFTQFSNPTKKTYTWNKSMPMDRDAFTQGRLAMYIGYASELPIIQEQNPNLNFDITMLPHLPTGSGENLTAYAKVYALAIPKLSQNPNGANTIMYMMTTPKASEIFSEVIGLPSPHNRLLATEPNDALKTTFRNSAIMARTWLDPNPKATYAIIAKMINAVTSGEKKMSQAIERANKELQVLLGQ